MICGPVARHVDGLSALHRSLIVAVLSECTETYDREETLAHYESIATLTDYVPVPSEREGIEHLRRSGPARWVVTRYLPSAARAPIESLGIALTFADVYDGWPEVRATNATPPKRPRRPRRS